MASTPGCSTRTFVSFSSSSGGTRTHSIPGSKPRWSAIAYRAVVVVDPMPKVGVEPTNARRPPLRGGARAEPLCRVGVPGRASSSSPGRTRTVDRHLVRVLPSRLGHGTINQGGSRGTRTHKRLLAAACLPSRFLIRPVGFRRCTNFIKFRGLESNQRPPGSEPGVTTSSNYPGSFVCWTPRQCPKFGEKGSNLRLLGQSQAAYR